MFKKLKKYQFSFTQIIFGYALYVSLAFNQNVFSGLTKYFSTAAASTSHIFEYFYILLFFLLILFSIVIFFLLVGTRYLLKPLILIILIISSILLYYQSIYGVSVHEEIILSGIDSVQENNFSEIHDLLSMKLFVLIFSMGIVPGIPLLFIKINYPFFIKEWRIRLLSIVLIIVVLLGLIVANYKSVSLTTRSVKEINKLLIPHYTLNSIVKILIKSFAAKKIYTILDSSPTTDLDDEIIGIVVIGETARADRFGINGYEKNTNPLLIKQNIINYKNASSCGTLTKISVPCMFFLGDYKNYSATNARYQQNALDVIVQSGIEVLWLENNSSCKHVCDRIKKIDTIQQGFNIYDETLVNIVEEALLNKISSDWNPKKKFPILGDPMRADPGTFVNNLVNFQKNKKSLIVLHTMGSHGPKYHERFPKEFEKFKPSCKSNNPQECTQEELSNAFDNTILYTDFILDSLIKILKKQNKQSFLIYASDHGESLGENGLYLHGIPVKFAPKEQTHIPWIVWYSDKYKKNNKISFVKSEEKITHEFFPHTILKSLKIKSTTLKEEKSLIRLN